MAEHTYSFRRGSSVYHTQSVGPVYVRAMTYCGLVTISSDYKWLHSRPKGKRACKRCGREKRRHNA
jgi:hypothetical protein